MFLDDTSKTSANFNPHSREGSDAFLALHYILGLDFNPHSREGSDFKGTPMLLTDWQFQSTLPRRE